MVSLDATAPSEGAAAVPATHPEAPASPDEREKGTRDRILDIALRLFIDKGFDKTSLREIADELGFSKAAIYYHFASKEDILMALHLRLHEFGREALTTLGQAKVTPERWGLLLDELIDKMLEQRMLFILHERNQAAFEHLHKEEHESDHDDLQARIRAALSDTDTPLESRVRMAAAFGAVMGGLVMSGDVFADVPSDVFGGMLRSVIDDLLGHGPYLDR